MNAFPRGSWGLLGALLLSACGTYDGLNVAKQQPGEVKGQSRLQTSLEGAEDQQPSVSTVGEVATGSVGVSQGDQGSNLEESTPSQPAAAVTSPLGALANAPTTNARPGERLRGRMLVTRDGQRAWQGWHDSELGQDCDFTRDEQGVLRCFPVAGTRDVFYSDASCTKGFARVDTSCEQRGAVEYAYLSRATSCGGGVEAHSLGDVVEPAGAFQLTADGTCAPVVLADGEYRQLGEALSSEQFVAAEYGVIDSETRVKSYGILAEDGAFSPAGFVDSELDLSCSWSGTEIASCVPIAQDIGYFSDESLTHPLIAQLETDCSSATPVAGVRENPTTCISAYYRSGTRFQGDAVYSRWGNVVANTTDDNGGLLFYRPSERILVEEFATANLQRVSSGGRLSPVYWYTEDGSAWFSHWHDTVLGTDCSFVTQSDGTALCVPRDAGTTIRYQDPTCRHPVAQVRRADTCEVEQAPAWVNQFEANRCGRQLHATYRVLAEASLQEVYRLDDAGSCIREAADESSSYYRLGGAVLPEQLADAEPTVE